MSALYLIDISSFIFRAYYAIRPLHNKKGEPTHAVYGVATMLARLIEDKKPEYLAVVYDSQEPSFRKEIYPEYKANRTETPEDLISQFKYVEEFVEKMGIFSFRKSSMEADDLIATLTRRWCELSDSHEVVIVSGDKDLMQLVSQQVKVLDTMTDRSYGFDEVYQKFNVRPNQIRDYLSLIGDSSDNIPGILGIGPKSAVTLLSEFEYLHSILKAARDGKISGKKGDLIRANLKMAELSYLLVTLRDQIELDFEVQQLKYKLHFTPLCLEFLEEMGFQSLVKRWGSPVISDASSSHSLNPSFKTVSTETDLKNLIHQIEGVGECSIDLETTSLNPREAKIVGISLCCDPQSSYYIPVGHQNGEEGQQLPYPFVANAIRTMVENPKIKKIGQNLKYDWSVLFENGFSPCGIHADTMLASYLLDPHQKHDLKSLSRRYLNYEMLTYEQVCGEGKEQITFDAVPIELATRYSAADAWVAFKVWNKIKPELEKEGLLDVFQKIDLPLVEVLCQMELSGVAVDLVELERLSNELDLELKEIEKKIRVYAQENVNLNSPKQLAKLLFEDLQLPKQNKIKTGFSTDSGVLETLSAYHEVPQFILEYREVSKLKSTYVDPLREQVDPKTKKVHTHFRQTIAATGRLSSSHPNLQNIPVRTERGMKIRRLFLPSLGHVFLGVDYNQIELRILAHMSEDPELNRAFQSDEDVHRRTASDIFHLSMESVQESQRAMAKAINFGLMYGKSAFGLSQELKISRKEAQSIMDQYFERYHGVKLFFEHQIQKAKERGYVETLSGRKRNLPELQSQNHAIRSNGERMAMNTPIQGTAADLMKLAMIEIHKKLREGGFTSNMVIQVHDELILDCPSTEVASVREIVEKIMQEAMSLSVPLRVHSALGKNWMEVS